MNADQIKTLKEALTNDDAAVRFNAGLDLVKQGDEAGIPALIEAFEQEHPAVRLFYASKTLTEMGQPAVRALTEALTTSNPQIQVAAAYTLYQIDNTQFACLLPFALSGLQSDNQHAFDDAIRFLGEVGQEAQPAIPRLLDILLTPYEPADPETWIFDRRVSAAVLLAKIGQPQDEIVTALIKALQYDVAAVRWGAACALAEIGEPASAATPTLTDVIRNETEVETIRVEAAYALAVIGNPEADTVPMLLDVCRSTDWWVRAFVARILGELGSPPYSMPEVQNFDWYFRTLIGMRGMKRLHDAQPIVLPLAEMLMDADYNVRRNATYALACIGEQAEAAIPNLIVLLQSEDIGPLAAEALVKIGSVATPALVEALNQADEIGRTYAAYALKLMNTPDTQDAITAADQSHPINYLEISTRHFYVQVHVMLDEAKIEAFETLYQATISQGLGIEVDYTLPYPKHEFLRYLVEHKGLLIHGSDKLDIDILKPLRRGVDTSDHGNVSGVYADMDPIRPIYFAIVHGARSLGQQNGFFEITDTGETSSKGDKTFDQRYYKLAVTATGLPHNFLQTGMMYILPPDTFEFWNEWTSREPVQPLMRLAVEPDDLPLRHEIWGSDWRRLGDNWVSPEDEFPFLKDARSHPILPSGKPAWL